MMSDQQQKQQQPRIDEDEDNDNNINNDANHQYKQQQQQPTDCRISSMLRAEWAGIQESVFLLIEAISKAERGLSSTPRPTPNVSRTSSRAQLLEGNNNNNNNGELALPPHLESSVNLLRDSFVDMYTHRNTIVSLGTEARAKRINFCAQKRALLEAESSLRVGAALVDDLPRLFREFSMRAVSAFTTMREEHDTTSAACEAAATLERERLTSAVRGAAQAHKDITDGVLGDLQDIINTKNKEIEMLEGMMKTMNRLDPAKDRRRLELVATIDDKAQLKDHLEVVAQTKADFEWVVLDVMRTVNSVNVVDPAEIRTTTPGQTPGQQGRKRRAVLPTTTDNAGNACAAQQQPRRRERDDDDDDNDHHDNNNNNNGFVLRPEEQQQQPAEEELISTQRSLFENCGGGFSQADSSAVVVVESNSDDSNSGEQQQQQHAVAYAQHQARQRDISRHLFPYSN